jgi:hypothetical protein
MAIWSPSGGLPALCSLDDVALEVAMYEAYHRFLTDFCASYPDRLTSVILVSGGDICSTEADRLKGAGPAPSR